jgi:hypothetical protein
MSGEIEDYKLVHAHTLLAFQLAQQTGDEFVEYLLSVVLQELGEKLKDKRSARTRKKLAATA